MTSLAQFAIKSLAFVGAVTVASLVTKYVFGPSREQRNANSAAHEIAGKIDQSMAAQKRSVAKTDERLMMNTRQGDVLGTAADPRLNPQSTAEQKAAAQREVNARMAAVTQVKPDKPATPDVIKLGLSRGIHCVVFAISTDRKKYSTLEATCRDDKFVGTVVKTEIMGRTAKDDKTDLLFGAVISNDGHRMTIPLSPENERQLRISDYIIFPIGAEGSRNPIGGGRMNEVYSPINK
jgi:hypothetical protein